jgi:hypothetical protein
MKILSLKLFINMLKSVIILSFFYLFISNNMLQKVNGQQSQTIFRNNTGGNTNALVKSQGKKK